MTYLLFFGPTYVMENLCRAYSKSFGQGWAFHRIIFELSFYELLTTSILLAKKFLYKEK